jgi:hypothetical protein
MSKKATCKLQNIVLMTRDVEKMTFMLAEVAGLKIVHQGDVFSELRDSIANKFIVRKAPSFAHSSYGFSPILNF